MRGLCVIEPNFRTKGSRIVSPGQPVVSWHLLAIFEKVLAVIIMGGPFIDYHLSGIARCGWYFFHVMF